MGTSRFENQIVWNFGYENSNFEKIGNSGKLKIGNFGSLVLTTENGCYIAALKTMESYSIH